MTGEHVDDSIDSFVCGVGCKPHVLSSAEHEVDDASITMHRDRAIRRATNECPMSSKKVVASFPAWTISVSGEPGCVSRKDVMS